MTRFVSPLLITIALIASAQHVHAQETASGALSGSGSVQQGSGVTLTTDDRLIKLQELLKERAIRTRADIAEKTERYLALEKDRAEYDKQLAALREQCKADIRRSNRDTKTQTTLDCYERELLLHLAFLRKESAYIKQLTGIRETTKQHSLTTLQQLSEAMSAIIDGIEIGIYDSPTSILGAHVKLWQNYRLPRYVALERIRADRALGWVGLLAQRTQRLWTNADAASPARPILEETAVCLTSTADILATVEQAKNYEETKDKFGQYQSSLTNCAKSLREAIRLGRPPEPVPAEGETPAS